MNFSKRNMIQTVFFAFSLFVMIVFVLIGNPGTSRAENSSAQVGGLSEANSEYRIGRGDQLEVMVWKEDDLSKTQAVRIDGRISMPLIGDVFVAGMSVQELKVHLEKKFGELVSEPSVSVLLVASKSWRYYVIGKIAAPGEYAIDYPITILQAIAKCGGFQEWAKISEIKIVRREEGVERIIPFDYENLARGRDLHQNILIKPGDTIIIP